MIDTHTHLNFEVFKDDWQEVVERAVQAGVKKMIVVGTDLVSSQKAINLAEENSHLFASVGIHPHHVRAWRERSEVVSQKSKLERLAKHPRAVAIGEMGLDYHKYKVTRYQIPDNMEEWDRIKKLQKELFKMQVELADELDKPLIIHSREAGTEVLEMIQELGVRIKKSVKGVFHCFEGSKKYLKQILEAGFLVGFTGNITYSHGRAEVAAEVPLNRLLLETDCPFMLPSAKASRGKRLRNEPKNVKIIGQFHAKSRGIYLNEVIEQTTKNAENLFGFR